MLTLEMRIDEKYVKQTDKLTSFKKDKGGCRM